MRRIVFALLCLLALPQPAAAEEARNRTPRASDQSEMTCTAYGATPAPAPGETLRRTYYLPEWSDLSEHPAWRERPRCSIRPMTVAVRDEGRSRTVYDDDPLRRLHWNPSAPNPVDRRAAGDGPRFDPVIAWIKSQAVARAGRPFVLAIYAHGGMVPHELAVEDGERMAPLMMQDGYTPLFLIWNSDLPRAYFDRLCCVAGGVESDRLSPLLGPVRGVGDLVTGVARAPEAYVQEGLRFTDTIARWRREYKIDDPERRDGRCNSAVAQTVPYVVYPSFCGMEDLNYRGGLSPAGVAYYANTATRVVTTAFQGIGAEAWANMIRRVRTAFNADPSFFVLYRNTVVEPHRRGTLMNAACESLDDWTPTQEEQRQFTSAGLRDAAAINGPPGAFMRFFARLQCEAWTDPRLANMKIDFYGHSMGAIIGDALMRNFPALPYRRIVYMGAAVSVRDTFADVPPVLRENPNARFFNLMLHPFAESHELVLEGVLPEGSLLEWIDEYLENMHTPDDRMVGKWRNVRPVITMFDPMTASHTLFRVFPLQPEMDSQKRDDGAHHFTQYEASFTEECARLYRPSRSGGWDRRCHPIHHGDFNQYAFWRARYLIGGLNPPADWNDVLTEPNDAPSASAPAAVVGTAGR